MRPKPCPLNPALRTKLRGMAPVSTLALGSLLSMSCALAGPNELMLQLDTSLRNDSNPFRFTDNANTLPAIGTARKGDSVRSADVRAAAIVPLDSPQTRLLLSGQIGKRDYRQFNQLDSTEGGYRAALQWRLGSLWRGELSRTGQSQRYQAIDGTFTQGAMFRTESTDGEVALRVTPDVQLPVKLSLQTLRYDNASLSGNDRNDRSIDLGANWTTGTNSSLRTGYKTTETRFVQRTEAQAATLDNEYVDKELYAGADWQYSVMSRIGGRVGFLRRNYGTLGNRDFSVLQAEMQATYDYSPLTRFTASLWNRPVGTTDPNTLYSINTGMQLGVRWLATPKTRFNLLLTEELQRYQSSQLGASNANPELRSLRLGVGVVHALSQDVRIYAEGASENLSRGTLGANIHQNSVRLGLEYTYENIAGVAQRAGFGEHRQ